MCAFVAMTIKYSSTKDDMSIDGSPHSAGNGKILSAITSSDSNKENHSFQLKKISWSKSDAGKSIVVQVIVIGQGKAPQRENIFNIILFLVTLPALLRKLCVSTPLAFNHADPFGQMPPVV